MLAGNAMADKWPDGSQMDKWFSDTSHVDVAKLGKQYVITDYGVVNDSNVIQTEAIQKVIDLAASNGGGVIVIPHGTFLSGSLFFKPNTHLHVNGVLKGSDRIADFSIVNTRIEGETCRYFAALVNADHVDGFTITGHGTINGNGYNYWREFWIRRDWNRQCTNKDAQRPRLTYISNCKNVTVQDVRLINSPFWTNHVYKSSHVRYLNCYIFAPTTGVKAPSSDAIDIDACTDLIVNGCYMNVNDDAVVLKGGKGTFADKDSTNGPCERILIQNCRYGTVHGCLTLGSESVNDRNIILRNCIADNANRVLWLKMRPDTPQHYEYVTVDNVSGNVGSYIVVRPWSQFFNPQKRDDMPLSECNNITVRNVKATCRNFFDVGTSDKYHLLSFSFVNVNVTDEANEFSKSLIDNTFVKNVVINGKKIK
ncbi:rhamnogalacturonidase [Prevotella herbatica]|nr:glycosyl hydrolase family 28 protein [Prevotella herbatica]